MFSHLRICGRCWVGVTQEGLDRREDGADVIDRAPLILQDIQADLTVVVDIRVEPAMDEKKAGESRVGKCNTVKNTSCTCTCTCHDERAHKSEYATRYLFKLKCKQIFLTTAVLVDAPPCCTQKNTCT